MGRAGVGQWAPPAPTSGSRLLQVLGPLGAQGRGPAALQGPSAGAHELQVQVSSAVLRTVSQAETSGHMPPPRFHTCSQVGDSSTRPPNPCHSFPPLKDRNLSLPRGSSELACSFGGHMPPNRVHTCFQVGDSSPRPPTPCDSCPRLKDRKVSLPRGRHAPLALSPFAVESQ